MGDGMKNVLGISKGKKIVYIPAAAMALCKRSTYSHLLTLFTFDLVIGVADDAEPFTLCHLTAFLHTIHMIDGIVIDLRQFELKWSNGLIGLLDFECAGAFATTRHSQRPIVIWEAETQIRSSRISNSIIIFFGVSVYFIFDLKSSVDIFFGARVFFRQRKRKLHLGQGLWIETPLFCHRHEFVKRRARLAPLPILMKYSTDARSS